MQPTKAGLYILPITYSFKSLKGCSFYPNQDGEQESEKRKKKLFLFPGVYVFTGHHVCI